MNDRRKVAVTILGAVAVLLGIAAALNALGEPFAASAGQQLAWVFAMNTFGGLLTAVFGLVAIAGARIGKQHFPLVAGSLFLLCALLTLLRTNASGNVLGGHAGTMSFFLLLGIGLVTLALSPEDERVRVRSPIASGRTVSW